MSETNRIEIICEVKQINKQTTTTKQPHVLELQKSQELMLWVSILEDN